MSIPELARHTGLDVQTARRAENGEPIQSRTEQSIAAALSKGVGLDIQVKARPARPAKAFPQERLQATYTCLLEQGEQVTKARLRQEARVSTDAAGAFLRAQRTRATTPTPQE